MSIDCVSLNKNERVSMHLDTVLMSFRRVWMRLNVILESHSTVQMRLDTVSMSSRISKWLQRVFIALTNLNES